MRRLTGRAVQKVMDERGWETLEDLKAAIATGPDSLVATLVLEILRLWETTTDAIPH